MQMVDTIQMPTKIGLRDSIGFARRLSQTYPALSFTFDFRNVRWVEPLGLLRTACAIRDFTESNMHRSQFQCLIDSSSGTEAIGYAAHMGFFRACNLDYGKQPGGPSGTTNIPITFEKVSELMANTSDYGFHMKRIARELTVKLIMPYSKSLFRPIEFSFLEVIRNVVEHSHSAEIGYCAQYWPNKDRVEIAIVDTGIGLRRSLAQNRHLDINSDGDALKYAILPGVSGKIYEGVSTDPMDDWENSGFGLYMNYRLCNEAGDFFICSGNSGLYRKENSADNQYLDTDFQGTILRLRLYPSKLSDQNPVKLFNKYRVEGEDFAQKSNNGANLTASKISGYIRNNFQVFGRDIYIGSLVEHWQHGVGKVEDLIKSTPDDLAIVSFYGYTVDDVGPLPLSSLILYNGPLPDPTDNTDIPL